MLSAAAGGPSLILVLGSGTAYSGSKRSELLTETTVRGSTRVAFTSLRGAAATFATASAGATTGGLIWAAGFFSAFGLASGAGLLSDAAGALPSFTVALEAATVVDAGAVAV